MFYTNVELIGNKIHERYIDDNGEDRYRVVDYAPCLFSHAPEGTTTPYQDIYGRYAQKRHFGTVKEARDWVRKVSEVGVEVLGQQSYVNTYISDTYRGHINYNQDDIRIACIDIEVTAPEFPEPKFAKYEIDMISHIQCYKGKNTYFVFDLTKDVGCWKPEDSVLEKHVIDNVVYFGFQDEKDLLLNYLQFWKENTPHFLTDWYGQGFDIPYIMNRYKNLFGEGIMSQFSPFGKIKTRTFLQGDEEQTEFTITGVGHLDFQELYKKFSFTTQPNYRLGDVANSEIGSTKLDYEGPIHLFRAADHQRYVDYCIRDTTLILDMNKKRCFIELVLSLSYYAHINYEQVFSSLQIWDAILYNSLLAQKKVLPQKRNNPKESFPGAFVKEPIPNFYKYVMSFDLTSLYPSIIRQLNISPETFKGMFGPCLMPEYINKTAPKPSEEFSCAPNGAMYCTEETGLIPIEIKKVFDQRKTEKGMMLAAQRNQEVIKKILAARG